MKLSKILLVFFLLGINVGASYSQNRDKAYSENAVVWYGVDYSLAKFTLVTESPQQIVSGYIPAINTLLVQEQEKKYNIRKFFNKSTVTNDLANVTEHNSKIDPAKLVISNSYTITQDDVKNLISSYDNKGATGMGLVFVAENMNKTITTGSFYVCFFDLATKEIIDSKRMEGKAAGFGFRNFWAGAVFDVMKEWSKKK